MTLIPLWVKLVILGVIVTGVVTAYNVHVNGLIDEAVTEAVTTNNGKWQESEQKAIVASRAQAKETEDAHRAELAAQAKRYEKEKADDKLKHANDITAVRSGAIKLRDAAATCASAGNDAKAANATGSGDGGKGAELSGAASEFLLSLANEADDIVKQLSACQQVILSDRKDSK